MTSLLAGSKGADTNGWKARHNRAVCHPRGAERPIVHMAQGWAEYAHKHATRYSSPIGDDGVLGPAWEQIGDGLRTLLNGECGALDCGTVDGFVLDTMRDNGVNMDGK